MTNEYIMIHIIQINRRQQSSLRGDGSLKTFRNIRKDYKYTSNCVQRHQMIVKITLNISGYNSLEQSSRAIDIIWKSEWYKESKAHIN